MLQNPTQPTGAYPALRRRAWSVFAFTTVLAVGLSVWVGSELSLSAVYPVKVAVLIPVLGWIVFPMLGQHSLPRFGPANRVTMGRAVLMSLLAGFVGEPTAEAHSSLIFWGTGFAFFLDGVDGWVARRLGIQSSFGAQLDMELDALTVMVLSMLLLWLGRAGPWVLLAGLLRYLYVAAGWIWPWLTRPLYETMRRKRLCGLQVSTAVFALLLWPSPWISVLLAGFGVVILVISFGMDVVWLFQRRHQSSQGEP